MDPLPTPQEQAEAAEQARIAEEQARIAAEKAAAQLRLSAARKNLDRVETLIRSTRDQAERARTRLAAARDDVEQARLDELATQLELAEAGYELQEGRVALDSMLRHDYTDTAATPLVREIGLLMTNDPQVLSSAAIAEEATGRVADSQAEALGTFREARATAVSVNVAAAEASVKRAEAEIGARAALVQARQLERRLAKVSFVMSDLVKLRSELNGAGWNTEEDTRLLGRVNTLVAELPEDLRGQLSPTSSTLMRPGDGEVTSDYGMRLHPIRGYVKLHSGTDFGAGDGFVYAAGSGVVVSTTYDGAWGNLTVLRHVDENGRTVDTWYAHQSQFLVETGDVVAVGDVIGVIGTTGLSTGPHLHFEVHVDGEPIDPMTVLSQELAKDAAGTVAPPASPADASEPDAEGDREKTSPKRS